MAGNYIGFPGASGSVGRLFEINASRYNALYKDNFNESIPDNFAVRMCYYAF